MDYKIKCVNEDFQVCEVSLMPQLSERKPYRYSYLCIRKSGFTTFAALEKIMSFFRLSFNDVCYQGLKDEDAVTEQIFSAKKIIRQRSAASFNKKNKFKDGFIEIKHIIGYGLQPVKSRMLHGNAFRIVVRNLNETTAVKLARRLSGRRHHQLINYYDEQRFGMPGGPYNTHLIGKAIVKRDWREAFEQIKKTANPLPKLLSLSQRQAEFKLFFKSFNPAQISFFVSSYNSFLWNRYTSALLKKCVQCELHDFPNVGKLHLPVADQSNFPRHSRINGFEFKPEKFAIKAKPYERNIFISTFIYAGDLRKDELHRGKKKVALSFFLPSGSYATMAVRQIFLQL